MSILYAYIFIVYFAFDKVLLKNSTTTTRTTTTTDWLISVCDVLCNAVEIRFETAQLYRGPSKSDAGTVTLTVGAGRLTRSLAEMLYWLSALLRVLYTAVCMPRQLPARYGFYAHVRVHALRRITTVKVN